MKNKKLEIILIVLLLITIISTILVVKTYADYAGVVGESHDRAYIARWNISMNSTNNFFSHEYELNLCNKAEDGTYVIAPGVNGKFDIIITNDGEVKANITKITFSKTEDSQDIPLVFSVDEKRTWKKIDDIIEVENQILNIGETKKVITIYWQWPLEGNDTIDTIVGIASSKGNKIYKLSVDLHAEQFIE